MDYACALCGTAGGTQCAAPLITCLLCAVLPVLGYFPAMHGLQVCFFQGTSPAATCAGHMGVISLVPALLPMVCCMHVSSYVCCGAAAMPRIRLLSLLGVLIGVGWEQLRGSRVGLVLTECI
jgi:hypothetical protein